ncbi:hypothetical protein [Thalassomonas haliotis]|uniref:Uncharacterized protein n=1 Tax=Thalassomonas haliotis TaxID=485448 RepID=A0ABY7VLI1_9GAMM|nr:hypothetical protein [Thalassomonas haliotis]WDE13542.1 hypothetical protein H3N35_08945 [Thalassomonas haliotis]
MGFFRSVWQDSQPLKRRVASHVAGTAFSGKAADAGPDVSQEFSSNRIQEADHVSDTKHKQVSGPSAALDSPTVESVVSAEHSGHGPQKVSQQQDSVSFGTTANGRTSALVEESLPVDPIVTERLAPGHVFDDILSSVNLVSLKYGLVTGEDVNRAASQDTEIRVPEQSSFVHAASVFSRDLMDLSVRADERNFQHDFGDLDTSRASGLDTPSEYLPGDSALLTPFAPFNAALHAGMQQAPQAVLSGEKKPANAGRGADKPQTGCLPKANAAEKMPATSGEEVLSRALLSPGEKVASRPPQPDGPLLSEHQRYLYKQKHFQQRRQQSKQHPQTLALADAKAQKEQTAQVAGQGAEPLQNAPGGQALPDSPAAAPLSLPANAAPADKAGGDKSGADQALAAFNALSALARQTGKGEQKAEKAADNSVHIGRIDVRVTADEAVKKTVAEQPPTPAAGWASRHYLRRV